MPLCRHIALFAVFVACSIGFGHVFVPHHHRADDYSVCAPILGLHHHADPDRNESAGTDDDNCCDIGHSVPSWQFTLRENDNSAQRYSVDNHYFHPLLLLRDNGTGIDLGRSDCRVVTLYVPPELGRGAQWGPGAIAGRAPPAVTVSAFLL